MLFVLLPLLAFAQKLYVGPTVGTRLSTVTFFEAQDKNDFKSLPVFGYDFGFMVSRKMKDRYCLNAELIYSHKSKLVKGTSNDAYSTTSLKPDPTYRNQQTNSFIELPIYYMIEFKNTWGKAAGLAGQQRTYKWFVGGGPTISYWLGGKGKLESTVTKEFINAPLNYKILFNPDSLSQPGGENSKEYVTGPNRFQFAINFTGGIALEPVGFQKIVVAAHLEIGQTFMSKGLPGYFPGDANSERDVLKAKYHSLRFSVSYLFDTKIENKKRGTSTIKNKNKKKKR